jgi:amino acid adenylation domain-containing protein
MTTLLQAAAKNRAGIVFIHDNLTEEYISYKDLYERALHVLGSLRHKGLAEGAELIIISECNKTLLSVFWACILGKIIPVPLSAGTRLSEKKKVFGVLNVLTNPFLFCDQSQLDKLKDIAAAEGMLSAFDMIRYKAIVPADLDVPSAAAVLSDITGEDIAYVQFSSGSTAAPKGVTLTHANLMSNIADIISSLGITDNDKLLSWMPLTHDMGMIGFHLTGLMAGVNVVSIPTSLFVRSPRIWMEAATAHKATVLYSPSFGLRYFLSSVKPGRSYSWKLSGVRLIVNGAEPIVPSLCREFNSSMAAYELQSNTMLAAYGLAEACVEVTAAPPGDELLSYFVNRKFLNPGDNVQIIDRDMPDAVELTDVGYPVSDCRVRICNDNDEVLTNAEVGHIQISGKNVTPGYYNNRKATEKTFTADGWLRTGDIGFMIDGRLVVTGRAKTIIIINGQNYYPQDIEQVLINNGIAPLGRIAACGNRLEEREELIIFVVLRDTPAALQETANRIRSVVHNSFGIIVDEVVPVKTIPKTTSGKAKYFQLLDEFLQQRNTTGLLSRDAGTDRSVKDQLLTIAADLFGLTNLDEQDDLLQLGSGSLALMQFTNRVNHNFGVQLSPEIVYTCSRIGALADYIVAHRNTLRPQEAIADTAIGNDCVSPAQARIFTECRLHAPFSAYNIPLILAVKGAFKPHLFERALKQLVIRHEMLRTSFHLESDRVIRKIHPFTEALLQVEEIEAAEAEVSAICESMATGVFVMEQSPLLRVMSCRLAPDSYRLIIVFHHIIVDGHSIALLLQELNVLYTSLFNGEDQPVYEPVRTSYNDYLADQRQWKASPDFTRQQQYWRHVLKDLPLPAGLNTRAARSAGPVTVAACDFKLSGTVYDQLKAICSTAGTTPFTVFMAMITMLLYRYTGQKDIVTGFDVSGRTSLEREQLVGYLLNTLLLRVQLTGDMVFSDLLECVKTKLLEAYAHQDYPFENMLHDIGRLSQATFSQPFSLLVLYQNFAGNNTNLQLPGCDVSIQRGNASQGFTELLVEVYEQPGSMDIRVQYDCGKYNSWEIIQFAEHLQHLLGEVTLANKRIASYNLAGDESEEQIHPLLNDHTAWPVHRWFERQALENPDKVAVVAGDVSMTFAVLNARANHWAYQMRQQLQAGPERIIGFCLNRNENMIVAMLAIMKTGAAFMPIDPELPLSRVEYMITNGKLEHLLVDTYHAARLDGLTSVQLTDIATLGAPAADLTNLPFTGNMSSLAYLMYTSGSTGQPKGVMIGHQSLVNYVANFAEYFRLTEHDVVVQQSSVAFDTMIEEIFPALCKGGTVIVAPLGGRDVPALINLIQRHKITILSTTPQVLNEVNQAPGEQLRSLRLVISGGDLLRPSCINNLFRQVEVYNTYGPTECTVCATYHKLSAPAEAGIVGTPLKGYCIYVLDENMMRLPAGKSGDIYIGGGLALGYYNDEILTGQRFVTMNGRRLYRTGDIGYLDQNGFLCIEGRNDHQVKIQGHRVNPSEIEARLCEYGTIRDCAVLQEEKNAYLVAYIRVDGDFSPSAIKAYLSNYFPVYMIPYKFIAVDHIPYTGNGKTDRIALRELHAADALLEQDTPLHTDEMTDKLSAIFRDVMRLPYIDSKRNFFEQGCTSLQAQQFVSRIREVFAVDITFKDVFIHATISELAGLVRMADQQTYQYIELG